jgi:hypothetical protein
MKDQQLPLTARFFHKKDGTEEMPCKMAAWKAGGRGGSGWRVTDAAAEAALVICIVGSIHLGCCGRCLGSASMQRSLGGN